MSEIKTKPTDDNIDSFLMSIEPEKKRLDSIELKKLFDIATDEKASLWNNNMIGYGTYHYKSEKSRQEGDWPLTAFSPRKQYIAIYIMSGVNNYKELLDKLASIKSAQVHTYINTKLRHRLDVLKK